MAYNGQDYYFMLGTRIIEIYNGENGPPVWQNPVFDKHGQAIVQPGDPVRAFQTNIPALFGSATESTDAASLKSFASLSPLYEVFLLQRAGLRAD